MTTATRETLRLSPQQLRQATDLAHEAGKAILRIYDAGGGTHTTKPDDSPLTEADRAAHRILAAGLPSILALPVLSEEGAEIPWDERRRWSAYWLIDPLDGTKEFLKRNGEFTVNVALVCAGVPVAGIVHAPALDRTYFCGGEARAFRQECGKPAQEIHAAAPPARGARPWRIVGSRSHPSPAFDALLADYPGAELHAMGSSLKLCLVAEGKADLYPRLGLTSEWDTAAAQAVAEAAGAEVVDAENGEPLRYNRKASLLNPSFLVRAAPAIAMGKA